MPYFYTENQPVEQGDVMELKIRNLRRTRDLLLLRLLSGQVALPVHTNTKTGAQTL